METKGAAVIFCSMAFVAGIFELSALIDRGHSDKATTRLDCENVSNKTKVTFKEESLRDCDFVTAGLCFKNKIGTSSGSSG